MLRVGIWVGRSVNSVFKKGAKWLAVEFYGCEKVEETYGFFYLFIFEGQCIYNNVGMLIKGAPFVSGRYMKGSEHLLYQKWYISKGKVCGPRGGASPSY